MGKGRAAADGLDTGNTVILDGSLTRSGLITQIGRVRLGSRERFAPVLCHPAETFQCPCRPMNACTASTTACG